jgi:hypothetical protein
MQENIKQYAGKYVECARNIQQYAGKYAGKCFEYA